MIRILLTLAVGLWAGVANATAEPKDLLIKFRDATAVHTFALMAQTGGAKIEPMGAGNWLRVQLTDKQLQGLSLKEIRSNPNILAIQPNYKVRLLTDYRIQDPKLRQQFLDRLANSPQLIGNSNLWAMKDNPEIPRRGSGGSGSDPQFRKQWGMLDIGVTEGWKSTQGNATVVAVLDSGVDYTHEDLSENLWRNPGEMGMDDEGRDKSTNKVDDDGNGYVDDLIGWDFVSNDNRPFDLAVDPVQLVLKGGNPGHGTHCAGNVAARASNGKGVVGVAPQARIMVLRFLSEKGEGDTVGAIRSIQYAVRMGAKVLSNSWGSEGEDPGDPAGNQALKDAIAEAEAAGALFIAAAGNGHQGVGYNNDNDAQPAYPASYPHDIIVSVAALDNEDELGSFSNWGKTTVDLGAPGVKIYSTTVGSKYSDTVIDLFGITAYWDGTSMATPHVAGAAALYWSAHPGATWQEVKAALFSSTKPINSLRGKTVTGGKLNVEQLMAE